MKKIAYQENSYYNIPINLVGAIAFAVVDELIVRRPNRPNHFNDKIVAGCLKITIERNPKLRRQIQMRLCNLAYQDDLDVRERAIQVAASLDLDDFLQLVRVRTSSSPDISSEIMYRLGRNEPLPTQKKSLANYTGQLEDLEKRSLQRWDDMAWQSKFNFWLRNVMAIMFFVASLSIIGVGVWLFFTSNDASKQGIGGIVSAITAIGGMLTKAWKTPVDDIKNSFLEQAGVEATFIGFMTRTGQIRLLFEQSYAKGEISLKELGNYQKMIADTQSQTAKELALIKGSKPSLDVVESKGAQT